MKRTSLLVALSLGITLATASARAADAPPQDRAVATPSDAAKSTNKEAAFTPHLDAVMLVPTGSLGDATGLGFGGMVGFEYHVSEALGFTGRAGYIAGQSKERSVGSLTLVSSIGELPVLAGVTYYPSDDHRGFFIAAEAGPILVSATAQLRGGPQGDASSTATSFRLGGIATAGYRAGAWDLRGGLFVIDAAHASDSSAALACVSYSFGRL